MLRGTKVGDRSLAEDQILAAWRKCRYAKEDGLAFGKVCYDWQQKFATKGGVGNKGRGITAILQQLNIPERTAYWWLNKYRESIGLGAKDRMKREHWLMPPGKMAALEAEFGRFDCDPAPYPRPSDYNGLTAPWGRNVFVNPPFRKSDGAFGAGPTAYVRRAIQHNAETGAQVVMTLPVNSCIGELFAANAECRQMGRIEWLDTKTKQPQKSGATTVALFILRPPCATPAEEIVRKCFSMVEQSTKHLSAEERQLIYTQLSDKLRDEAEFDCQDRCALPSPDRRRGAK